MEELVEEELVEEELSRDASRRASGSMGVVLGESGMKLGLLIPFNSARVPVSGVSGEWFGMVSFQNHFVGAFS